MEIVLAALVAAAVAVAGRAASPEVARALAVEVGAKPALAGGGERAVAAARRECGRPSP